MLQLALFLYLAGIVVLLWTINNVVAALLSAVIGSFFTFYAFTCILPVFSKNCPYRSSLAWGFSITINQFILPSASSIFRRMYQLTSWGWFDWMRKFLTPFSTWRDCSTWTDIDLEGTDEGPERTERHEEVKSLKPLSCEESIKWTAQVLPVAEIDSITPLWSELGKGPQETFFMWLFWQARGYKEIFSEQHRQDVIGDLWRWSGDASDRHRAQAWKRTFLAMLRGAVEDYCKDAPRSDHKKTPGFDYSISTIVDMTRLTTKNPWVDLADKDIREFAPVFRKSLSRTLREILTIIQKDTAEGSGLSWQTVSELENLAREVNKCTKDGLNQCRRDCEWYHDDPRSGERLTS
jgi:hypothetical protein